MEQWEKCATAYFENGKMRDVKDALRSIFNLKCGTDGALFHGIKLTRGDFAESDIRKAMTRLCGGASRTMGKDAQGNPTVGKFDWRMKYKDKAALALALTDLIGVTLESRVESYERKPQETEPATSATAATTTAA